MEDEMEAACRMCRRGKKYILGGKPEGNRPLGRPRHRWEENVKMGLRKIGCEDVDWIHLAHIRIQWWPLVNTVMNLQVL
jgi:hypothetical protein